MTPPFEGGRVPTEEDLREFVEPVKKGRKQAPDTKVLYEALNEGDKALLIYTGSNSTEEATSRRNSLGSQLKRKGYKMKITQKSGDGETKLLFEKVYKPEE